MTAPKFLGYSFNPVSLWYLYSADRKLSAMILEVNNTFDERHMYFLKPSEDSPEGISHSKLVARIFSEGLPVDPQTMSTWHKLKFLLSWWWVGLVTYPRIVREASKLFFRRKLHV
jgi:Protein of unknown function (DUF1365)